jgi:ATP-dependent Clp protease ATP-binding subunit ClpC
MAGVPSDAGGEAGPWPPDLADGARRAMAGATDAARGLGQRCVGTEHVLLALTEAESGLAARVLSDLGVTREAVLGRLPPLAEPRPPEAALVVMPRLGRALDLAADYAARVGHGRIETEHLLAGVVGIADAMALCVLESLGVDAADVRRAVASRLDVDERLLAAPRRRRRWPLRRHSRSAA